MAYVPLALAVLGILAIAAGIVISILDWNKKNRRPEADVVTESASLPEAISALAKLAQALKDLTPGMQLIFAGLALEVFAAFWGGIVAMTAGTPGAGS